MELEQFIERVSMILRRLDQAGPSNVNTLARELGMNYNTLQGYIRLMEARGWVQTRRLRTSPPQREVRITEKGKCILKCL